MDALNNNSSEAKNTLIGLINFLPKWLRASVALLLIGCIVYFGYIYFTKEEKIVKTEKKVEQIETKKVDTITKDVETEIIKTQSINNSYDHSKQLNVEENKGTINVN